MVKFRVSKNTDFGSIGMEGNDEKEILDNLRRFETLTTKITEIFGYDVKIPESVNSVLGKHDFIERMMIVLHFSPKPLSRDDFKKRSQMLGIPEGWWRGSNFYRDIRKKMKIGVIEEIKGDPLKYKINSEGKKYVRSLLKNVRNESQN